MSRSAKFAVLVAIVALAMAVPAFARGPESSKVGKDDFFMDLTSAPDTPIWTDHQQIEELGLTEEQVAALKESDFTLRERQIDMYTQVAKAELELQRVMSDRPLDTEKAKKAAKKLADLKGRMFLLEVEHRLSIHTVLTPEQIEKLEKSRPYQTRRYRREIRRMIRNYDEDGESR